MEDKQCVDYVLNRLRRNRIVDTLKPIGTKLIFLPLELFPGGKGFKISVEVLKMIVEMKQKGLSDDVIAEWLARQIGKIPGLSPKQLKDILKKWIRQWTADFVGTCRAVSVDFETALKKAKEQESIRCELLVCGEVEYGFLWLSSWITNWSVSGACRYTCTTMSPRECCRRCGREFAFGITGTGSGTGNSCTKHGWDFQVIDIDLASLEVARIRREESILK